MQTKTFVNYYEILGLAPSASSDAIERKFRQLARRFHPDNLETGDRATFDKIVEAHETIKDSSRRARYHEDHKHHLPAFVEEAAEDSAPEGDDSDGADDREGFVDSLGIDRDLSIQNNILMMLYFRRRRNIREPGIGNAELEMLSGCPSEHLEFHLWYLKAKGWIATGDDGLLAITIDGVDRAAAIYADGPSKLITDQS